MLGNFCMGIEAVNYVKMLDKFGSLMNQICCASAAENQHVDLILEFFNACSGKYGCARNRNYTRGITSCENTDEFSILIFQNGFFNATAKIAVAKNTDFHRKFLRILI